MSGPASTTTDREFSFKDKHFQFLRSLARDEAGIELSDAKRELVYGRLARRLRALGLPDFDAYCRLLEERGSQERANFVNAITTNVTQFFREDHHFDFLTNEAFPRLTKARAGSRRLRIWSSACSTGQEPYSIAMTTAAALNQSGNWDWRILATDIDTNALARARAGVYTRAEAEALLDDPSRRRWIKKVPGIADSVRIDPELAKNVYFRSLNLMEQWPMSGPLDVIFCRNVVIYFSEETQRRLFARMRQLLSPDGYLFIGHSESMLHSTDLFEAVGRTVYRPRPGTG